MKRDPCDATSSPSIKAERGSRDLKAADRLVQPNTLDVESTRTHMGTHTRVDTYMLTSGMNIRAHEQARGFKYNYEQTLTQTSTSNLSITTHTNLPNFKNFLFTSITLCLFHKKIILRHHKFSQRIMGHYVN